MTLAKPQITRVAAYGLVVKEARLLLCRISARLPLDAGQWTLPGGGIDFGEAPADAMVCEVEEESGLLVCPLGLVGSVDRFTSTVKETLLLLPAHALPSSPSATRPPWGKKSGKENKVKPCYAKAGFLT